MLRLEDQQTTHNKQQTTNNKQETTNDKQHTANNKQQTTTQQTTKQQTTNNRLKLLNRAAFPIAAYRMTRWPYQKEAAKWLDRVQNSMTSKLLQLKPQLSETEEAYVRRRNRMPSEAAAKHGRWSAKWAARVVSWHDHLLRPLNSSSWAAKTLQFHGRDWLQKQRIMHSSGHFTLSFGRTRTRAGQGKVHQRWHDGLALARSSMI